LKPSLAYEYFEFIGGYGDFYNRNYRTALRALNGHCDDASGNSDQFMHKGRMTVFCSFPDAGGKTSECANFQKGVWICGESTPSTIRILRRR